MLRGRRVFLRDLVHDDARDVFGFASDPEVSRYLSRDVLTSVEQAADSLVPAIEDARENPRTVFRLGVCLNDTNSVVGIVRLSVRPTGRLIGDVGFELRRDLWGRGLIGEATSLLLDHGFGALGLHRIWADHQLENTASRRVLEKLGFVYEGVARESMRSNGRWCDMAVRSLLDHEWSLHRPA
jgi:RimJ/RimL family protein N-acetyltransferase